MKAVDALSDDLKVMQRNKDTILRRERIAYDAFRGGFRRGAVVPPHWDDLESWMRDALMIAYLQGKLDGKANN